MRNTIKANEIKSETVREVSRELELRNNVMQFIRANGMRGSDAIEAMAMAICYTDEDIDMRDFVHIS